MALPDPSIRERVLENVEMVLGTISGVGEVTRLHKTSWRLGDLPGLVVNEPEEEKTPRGPTYQVRMRLEVGAFMNDTRSGSNETLNDTLEAVEKKLMADPTRGGWATHTEIVDTAGSVTSQDKVLVGVVTCDIHYKHAANDPTSTRPGG